MNYSKRFCFLFFYLCLVFTLLNSEILSSEKWGYTIDLPEGFHVAKKDTNTIVFENMLLPVKLTFSVVQGKKNLDQIMNSIFTNLNANHKDIDFLWAQREARLSNIQFTYTNTKKAAIKYVGWVMALKLDKNLGWLTVISYTPEKIHKKVEPMIISSFDSIFIGDGSVFIPGPVTTALYPSEGLVNVQDIFRGKAISFFYDKSDKIANQSVVDREFDLLTAYINNKLSIPAWKRYYRAIYRDAWNRMHSFSFAIKNSIYNQGTPPPRDELASAVLSYIQNFRYVRDHSHSDFLNIPSCSITKSGDCDSRAILMSIVLQQLGIDCIVAISPEFSHAIAVVDVPGKGARLNIGRKSYLVAETTAKVELGKIASDIADPKKWFLVDLYKLAE